MTFDFNCLIPSSLSVTGVPRLGPTEGGLKISQTLCGAGFVQFIENLARICALILAPTIVSNSTLLSPDIIIQQGVLPAILFPPLFCYYLGFKKTKELSKGCSRNLVSCRF